MKAVSNTTPLIYLYKSSLLPLLKTLHQSVLITEEVYKEAVIKGELRGYNDAISIKDAVRDWILVKKVSAAIKTAKMFADAYSFKVIGTGKLIDEGLEKGFISKSDYERFLEVIGYAAYAA
ncbi:MAG: hypothetical protein AABY54_09805 [Deltaproteobacteria bacterium]